MKGSTAALVGVLLLFILLFVFSAIIYANIQKKKSDEESKTADSTSTKDRYATRETSDKAIVPQDSAFQPLKGTVGLWFNGKGNVRVTKTGDMVMLMGKDSSVVMKVDHKNYGSGKGILIVPIAWSNILSLSAYINVPGLLGGVFVNTEKHVLKKMETGWHGMEIPIDWDYVTNGKHELTITITLTGSQNQTRLYMLPAF